MNALTDFSRLLLETSSPSESVEMRLCTAQVLGHANVTEAMFDAHGTLGEFELKKKKVSEAFVGTFLPELKLYFLDSFCIGNFNL